MRVMALHVLLLIFTGLSSLTLMRVTSCCLCFHDPRNPQFRQSVKELKEKAEELKGVKEDLKAR